MMVLGLNGIAVEFYHYKTLKGIVSIAISVRQDSIRLEWT